MSKGKRKNPIDAEPAISERSLNALFQKDPKKLTRKDRSKIVEAFRVKRVTWEREEKDAKNKGKKAKHETGISVDDIQDLLGDLDKAMT